MTNTTGETLRHLTDLCSSYDISNAATNKGGLIYINNSFNMIKLSNDMKTTTELRKHTLSIWINLSVYWSPLNRDLLNRMSLGYSMCWRCRVYTHKSKVNWYAQKEPLKQTMEFDNTGLELCNDPHKTMENYNGNVVVPDCSGAVVVTERWGKHRLSYTGHPLGSAILPSGICTDVLSHMLVCDNGSTSIQLIDNNGQFLQFLFTTTQADDIPRCLSYDTYNQRL